MIKFYLVCLLRNELVYHAQTGSGFNENGLNNLGNLELGSVSSNFVTEIARKKISLPDNLFTEKDVLK